MESIKVREDTFLASATNDNKKTPHIKTLKWMKVFAFVTISVIHAKSNILHKIHSQIHNNTTNCLQFYIHAERFRTKRNSEIKNNSIDTDYDTQLFVISENDSHKFLYSLIWYKMVRNKFKIIKNCTSTQTHTHTNRLQICWGEKTKWHCTIDEIPYGSRVFCTIQISNKSNFIERLPQNEMCVTRKKKKRSGESHRHYTTYLDRNATIWHDNTKKLIKIQIQWNIISFCCCVWVLLIFCYCWYLRYFRFDISIVQIPFPIEMGIQNI